MRTRIAGDLARKAISVGFVLIGLALLAFALVMVWMFGEGLGDTWLEKRVYGGAHVALHLVGILCAFALAILVVDKSKAFALLCLVALLCVGSYSIVNMIGFASKNHGGVAQTADNIHILLRYEGEHMDPTNWRERLAGPGLVVTHSQSDREPLQRRPEASKPPIAVAARIQVVGAASLPSRFVHEASGEEMSEVLAIPFELLLFIGEIFSFIFGASLWPRVQAPTAQAPVATGTIIETGTAGVRESSVGSGKRVPPVEAGANVGSWAEPANPAVVGTRAAPSVAGHRLASVQEHVELVVTVLRELGMTEVPAFVVHEFYSGFMQGKGIQPLPINHFCQMLAMVCARCRKRYDRDGTGKNS